MISHGFDAWYLLNCSSCVFFYLSRAKALSIEASKEYKMDGLNWEYSLVW